MIVDRMKDAGGPSLALGLPMDMSEPAIRRLRARNRRLIGRAPRDDLQTLITDANRRVASVISRLERGGRRPSANVPPELRAQVERFEDSPKDHAYVWVKMSDVAEDVRDAVADGVRQSVNKLNGFPGNSDVTPPLPTPSVRFFRAARDGERADFTDRRAPTGVHTFDTNFIDIRMGADRTPAQARRSAAHECWHWSGKREARDEVSAANFAAQFVA